ncbi:restriction endonuclease [Lactobacillus mellis]|uniref:restriction endonuclease FokI C-terminal domain-containing protein n=1 Tax=Bombilactobacillus mellis TaxID=1218508 RepID=UPI001580566F|nr:restriction endonuclease FokI C-terminal domain-containing protein [Bombilactobacillus mellis]NUG66644.1 restriction endonuclease [Bombilactobacillus mellis]
MKFRTFGWVQNPSDFTKLKKTVQVFDPKSDQYKELTNHIVKNVIYFNSDRKKLQKKLDKNVSEFTYEELVGTSRNKKNKAPKYRKDAIANSLLQVTILSQSSKTKGKLYTDNWTADGFLRWAVSLNFVSYNREKDTFKITELGKKLSNSDDGSSQEMNILQEAMLSYPPATRVLSLLATSSKQSLTKFAIGNNLGFVGEKGFTSYDEGLMIDWLKSVATKEERNNIRRNIEGTSDKYARMISGWLVKLKFVEKHTNKYKVGINEYISGFQTYSITAKGLHAINQANGLSKNKTKKKFVMWEFLAISNKQDSEQTRDFIRTRRAKIILGLKHHHTISALVNYLKHEGFNMDESMLNSELKKLISFGLRIKIVGKTIKLQDNVFGICIPDQSFVPANADIYLENMKNHYRKITNLPERYLELLDVAFDHNRHQDFEIMTAGIFKDCYGLSSIHLGGQNKPDGVIYNNNFGIILDTKAYEKGYGMHIDQIDEMCRYIYDNKQRDIVRQPNEWWNNFDKNIPKDQFYYLWVSGKFLKNFDKQLKNTHYRTNINGGGLEVSQLLLGADAVMKGNLDVNTLPNYMKNNVIKLVI